MRYLVIVNIGSMLGHVAARIASYPTEVKANIDPYKFVMDMFAMPRDHIVYRNSCEHFLPYGYLDAAHDLLLDDMDFMLSELDEMLNTQISYLCPPFSDLADQFRLTSIIEPHYGRFIYDTPG